MKQIVENYIIRDVHRNVHYEVVKWRRITSDNKWIWNYYIFLEKSKVKPEIWDKIWFPKSESYTRNKILKKIPFHYGITYYHRNFDIELLKIGCDYNHLWDENTVICEDFVIEDAKETIDYIVDNFIVKETEK